MIEAAIENLAGDGDAQISRLREVRQSHPTRRMLLSEDHLTIRAVYSPRPPDAALQGPSHAGAQLRMPATQFLEDGDGSQSRRGLNTEPPPFSQRSGGAEIANDL